MAVLLPGKFLYLATPHTATVSTTVALAQLEGAIPTLLNKVKQALGSDPQQSFPRATHHATRQQLEQDHAHLFRGNEIDVTVVRHPLDLIVTWWLRGRSQAGHADKLVSYPSFEEFVATCDETNLSGPYLRDGRVFWLDAKVVLRYESLQQDLDAFLDGLGLPPVELPRHNVTADKKKNWRDHYNAATLELAWQRFGAEGAAYGYKKDPVTTYAALECPCCRHTGAESEDGLFEDGQDLVAGATATFPLARTATAGLRCTS